MQEKSVTNVVLEQQQQALAKDPTLVAAMYKYARENLALVNIYIKDPAVTQVKRDQKVPLIWFIANIGGILGLTMGCSLVTVFEILHHMSSFFFKTSAKSIISFQKSMMTRTVPNIDNNRSSVKHSVPKLVNNAAVVAMNFDMSELHSLSGGEECIICDHQQQNPEVDDNLITSLEARKSFQSFGQREPNSWYGRNS